jgi:hypothetical protein
MGLGIQWGGPATHRWHLDCALILADTILSKLTRWISFKRFEYLPAKDDAVGATTAMLHGTAFTPVDLRSTSIVQGDRPYAFLLGWTVARTRVDKDSTRAWTTETTIGTIGSPLGHWVQSGIHAAVRSLTKEDHPPNPSGWRHQVLDSPAGIPTARYSITFESPIRFLQWKARTDDVKFLETTWNTAVQVGYYTEADVGGSLRFGLFSTPFWLFHSNPLSVGSRLPDLSRMSDTSTTTNAACACHQPLPPSARPLTAPSIEWFVFGRGQERRVGYNALLEGYGSWNSDYVLRPDQISRWIGEYSYGMTISYMDPADARRSFALTYVRDAMRTAEFVGPLARSHYWGSLFVAWTP